MPCKPNSRRSFASRSRRPWLIASLLLSCSLPTLHGQAVAAKGAITGAVYNAATRNYVANVEVRDVTTGARTVTDVDGRYSLPLTPGKHTLTFSYSGLDARTEEIEVTAGGTVEREIGLTSADYDSNAIQLSTFVVAADKEGRAASIAQQRESDHLVNVISSDEFPNVAGGNVGDFLRNVPGISIEYSGPDPRWVSVRGMDPNMTGVMVNGMRAASASSANSNRRFEFDQTSLQDIESVEIFKTPNAAMDGDSGAGAVNIISKSAFKLKGRRISYSALANMVSSDIQWGKAVFPDDGRDRYSSRIRPGGTFSYSDSFFNNRLGVVVTGNYNEYFVNSHNHNNNYNLSAATAAFANFPVDGPTGLYSRGFTYGINPITTLRTSISVNLDFRLSNATTLWLRTQANTSQLHGGGRSIDVGVNAPVSPAPTTNGVAAGWTAYSLTALGAATATTADAAASSSTTFSHVSGEYLDKVGADTKFSLGSTTKTGPWKIDTAVATSLSTNHYRNHGHMPVPQVDLYLRGIDFRIDSPSDSNYPTITQLSGPSIYDLSNYVSRVATGATATVPGTNTGVNSDGLRVIFPDTSTGTGATAVTYPAVSIDNGQYAPFQLRNGRRAGATDKYLNGKFDVRRNFATRWPSYTQFGASFRRQDRAIDRVGQARWLYVGPDGVLGSADDYTTLNLTQFKSTNISDTFGPYPQIPFYDLDAINKYFMANRNLFKEDLAFRFETEGAAAKTIREEVLAAYAMENIKIGRLNVLLGLRYEKSDSEGEGPAVDNEGARDAAVADLLAYVRTQGYATVNAAPAAVRSAFRADAGKLARIRYAKRTTSTRSFDDLFPNVQTRFAFTKNLVLRMAYNKSIARQDFTDVMPGYSVAAPANNSTGLSTVTISNTKLKPIYFNNYDVSLEYYLPQGGLLSASVYRKDVKNYTFNSTETILSGVDYGYDLSGYIGDNLVRKVNGGSARHKGIELSYSQRLGQFATWLKPYSFYTGFTYQKAEGTATFGGSTTQLSTLPLRNVVPRMFNASLRYRARRLAVSMSYNWKSHYPSSITTNSVTPGSVLIRSWDNRGTLDSTLSYDFFKQHSLFVDVRNLTNEPYREYVVNRSFTRAYAINGATIYVGIKGNF